MEEKSTMSSQLNKYRAKSRGRQRKVRKSLAKARESGRKWDGTSRPSTDEYRRHWNEIFKNNMGDN